MLSYRTPWPVAHWDEKFAPVPGWGMNPRLAGPRDLAIEGFGVDGPFERTDGLGVPFTVTVMGVPATVDVPMEQMFAPIDERIKKQADQAKIAGAVAVAAIVGSVFLAGWYFSRRTA
jgi:hypothetical protein